MPRGLVNAGKVAFGVVVSGAPLGQALERRQRLRIPLRPEHDPTQSTRGRIAAGGVIGCNRRRDAPLQVHPCAIDVAGLGVELGHSPHGSRDLRIGFPVDLSVHVCSKPEVCERAVGLFGQLEDRPHVAIRPRLAPVDRQREAIHGDRTIDTLPLHVQVCRFCYRAPAPLAQLDGLGRTIGTEFLRPCQRRVGTQHVSLVQVRAA